MNCFIWILLLLGCGGNCSNGNNSCRINRNCKDNCDRCSCNRCNCDRCNGNSCEEMCGGNMIQPRNNDDCGCRHHHHENDCMTPPPVPRYVIQEDDCGCNN